MATTTRQTSLLVNQDWTKLYQTFRSADFQSYDFETLRASMISYLRTYYPEDFNDFIESSEFIALIDMIAFMGQSIAFRGDLNARENFIDTAERRDSILKLARLVSYSPKRTINASGLLKFDSVSTTENVYDSNGINLSGLVVNWADSGNDNWYEQFTAVLNAALQSNQVIGKPSDQETVNGIAYSSYAINLIPSIVPTYAFSVNLEGSKTAFEMVSPTFAGQQYVYETPPEPNLPFNFIYENDGLGNSSPNTGFFLYFKQGALNSIDVNFLESLPNRVYSINVDNINNVDVWLWSLDVNGNPDTLWTQVPAVYATNVIYNQSTTRTLYQVNTRAGDQIDLVFGDGSFADIPQGNFRIYYRVSNGLTYKITPSEMQGIVVPINYTSQSGRTETITIRASLQYTVTNAISRETIDDIRQKAPQNFYTQNRMITGEDYNILPYTLFSDIVKIKAVNRTSSGISRYLDVIDTTGKYSSTNIFCDDGMLYRQPFQNSFSFTFNSTSDIYKVIFDRLYPITSAKETLQFFYANFPLIPLTNVYWNFSTAIANGSTGYFVDANSNILEVGAVSSSNTTYIIQGAIVRFNAGAGNYFDAMNTIQVGTPSKSGDKYYIYAAVELLIGDGTNGGMGNLSNGQGPITLNQQVPMGAIADKVFAVFNNNFTSTLIAEIVSYTQAYENFGLRYDVPSASWKIILPQDLSLAAFSLTYAGDTSGQQLDSSWLINFQTTGQTYTVNYLGLYYVFESVLETNFYFDGTVKVYDAATGLTVHDQINVLKVNSQPDTPYALGLDYTWYIYAPIIEADGYQNPNAIYITFSDVNNDGVPDNPELFDIIVSPNTNTESKYVYFQATYGTAVGQSNNFVVETPVDATTVVSIYNSYNAVEVAKTTYQDGQLFYIPSQDTFYQLSVSGSVYTLNAVTGYTALVGRQDLYFQYRHNSPNYRRIDPSPNNIIDLYILTQSYATDYVAWLQDTSGTISEPTAPTGEELSLSYSSLDNYKAISDNLIFNPAQFKPLFGAKADPTLRATFKVVKNTNVVVSDSDVQTSVIAAINTYFDIANWDFGETFYFSELAAYLHQQLVPNVSSITIVPASTSSVFGSLLQVNANYNEIIQSAATVDNVEIIPAITAAQINQTGTFTT